MAKIKLLFVISNLNIGGPQKSLLALTDRIDYSKFKVDILVLKSGGTLKPYFNKNIRIITVDPLTQSSTLPSDQVLISLKLMMKKRKYSMVLTALIYMLNSMLFKTNMNQQRQKFWLKYNNNLPLLENKYDLAFGILGLSTYYLIDKVNSIKKFHWIRSDIRVLNRDVEIDSDYYKKLDGCLSVSHECSDIFVEEYPFMKDKVKVFYNYIPESFYSKQSYDETLMKVDEGVKKILTIARIDPFKGLDLAIDACEILVKEGYKFKWFILGDGKHKENIVKMIKEKKLEEYFVLLGFQLNTIAFIKDSDIIVHPSRFEGKSNAVDEAKMCFKPIVVTNYPTVNEQIEDNVTGLICEMQGQAIAKAVSTLFNDNTLSNKLIEQLENINSETVKPSTFLEGLI